MPNYQHHTVALRQLTGKGRPFLWLPEHQHEFDTLKQILSGDLVVRHFNSSKDVILLTDASHLHGLGYALGHMDIDSAGSKHFKIVHCGSKGLTTTQQRYSTIELECLAIVWAIMKCSFYLHGLPKITVYTNHRPLEGFFQKSLFDLASPRLQRMREKIAKFSFQVSWVPGKTHLIADALSGAPLFSPQEQSDLEVDTAITYLVATSHPSMDVIYCAIDENYLDLFNDVLNGTSISSYSRSLKSDMASLSVSDGLILLDSRHIVLPLSAVKPVLKLLHASHSDINKTIVLVCGLYYWPGMINDVKQPISSCCECTKLLQSQPANPMITAPPSHHFGYPMQHVGLDLFSFGGKSFLICVDHWSGYPLYQALRSLSSDVIISILITWFNTLGWPSSIRSDGGPQFCEDFPKFFAKHGISHELSAPYNPKGNSLAEADVRSVKNILVKSYATGTNPAQMLYEWRNVPRTDGFSPAQLLLGRQQRTGLPTLPSQICPIDFSAVADSKDTSHDQSKLVHDRLQDPKTSAWTRIGIFSSIRPDHLSYTVSVDGRSFIRPRPMLCAAPLESCSPPAQAPAQITPSLSRRSERLQLRATSLRDHTSANLLRSIVLSPSLMRSTKRSEWQSGRELQPPQPLLLPSSFTTRPTCRFPTTSATNPRRSNNGFSLINLHWTSFSMGLSSVLAVIISLALIAGCCYNQGRRQRQSRARHTELLRTIVQQCSRLQFCSAWLCG